MGLQVWWWLRRKKGLVGAPVLEVANLFVDENGDYLVDENGNRLGET